MLAQLESCHDQLIAPDRRPAEGNEMNDQKPMVGDALSRGWQAFQGRFSDFIIVAIVAAVIEWLILLVLMGLVFDEVTLLDGPLGGGSTAAYGFAALASVALGIIVFLITIVANAYYTRISLTGVDGETISFSEVNERTLKTLWAFAGWVILVGICIIVGFALLIIPGIIAIFFLLYVPFLASDGRRGPFMGSGSLAMREPGGTILLMLLGLAALVVSIIVSFISAIPFIGYLIYAIVRLIIFAWFACTVAAFYRASGSGIDASVPGAAPHPPPPPVPPTV